MIGRLLSGRYRIEAVVGTGGMAVVYRALDLERDQIVAIKVLRPEYESDMEFVRRFSREAEAAAKMAHENIVNMLDVGIDGEKRYIVMEYVDGRTLKQMICEEKRIHPDVALRMTMRILAAVDHAHRNGIVHRDIKPQNILVDKGGRVKVADFGIARLKTSQTGNLSGNGEAMGSVHYLSPEQAQGELADEQSDLYSVGVVLYEMLTGHVPFDGETAVSVALKHVSERPKSMRMLNAQVSRALDEVVMRALCKEKERRYRSAAEMAADLRQTLVKPKGGFVRYPVAETKDSAAPQRSERKRASGRERKRGTHVLIMLSTLTLVLVLAFGAYYHKQVRGTIPMPALVGISEAQAVEQLRALGLYPTVVSAYSEEIEAGKVMLQSSNAGEMLREDAKLTLTVSKGSQWFYLQDMQGWKLEEALSYFDKVGVTNVQVDYDQSDFAVGTVISTGREEGWYSRDEEVLIKVSGQSASVPALTGLTLDGVCAVLEAEGLKLGNVTEGASADAQVGRVISQSIAPYTRVLADTAIDLCVCRAHEQSCMPTMPLMVVVPLEELLVKVELLTPSGELVQAYSGVLAAGSHRLPVTSSESGSHTLNIYMDDTLYERLQLDFS